MGRVDQQVKIRGHRIELEEIAARLREHSHVREAVVVAREAGSSKQLVGYVVAEQAASEDTLLQALREDLRRALPGYMIPAHLTLLAALPLTPSGKVDLRALPAPELSTMPYEKPESYLAEQLAEIWQDVLGVERVGLRDNFFELGGDSILAMQVIARIRSSLQINVPLARLFEVETLAQFERVVESDGYSFASTGE